MSFPTGKISKIEGLANTKVIYFRGVNWVEMKP